MTSTRREKRNTPTGTTETTTPDTAEFVSQKGTEFTIETALNGLFFIKMRKGGKAPAFCDEYYTSKKKAQEVLNLYLIENDRISHLL